MTVDDRRDTLLPEGSEIASNDLGPDTLAIAEERATIGVVRRETGGVRVRVLTDEESTSQTIALASQQVEVTRHPVGREIDSIPEPREEGDLLIVPVVEERAVVVTRLFLTEEIHIRRTRSTESVEVPVTLRRQHAVVEQLEPAFGSGEPSPAEEPDLDR